MKHILFTTNDRCPDDLYETFNDSTADLINFFCNFPENVAYGKQRTTRVLFWVVVLVFVSFDCLSHKFTCVLQFFLYIDWL